MQQAATHQEAIRFSGFHGVDTSVAPDALKDYVKWRLTHLQALAALMIGQDESCHAVNADTLELNRALIDELAELMPLALTPA